MAALLGAVVGGTGVAAAQQRPDSAVERAVAIPTEAMLGAHLRFLASDLLRGRGTGTYGSEVAAHYIAAQFEALGLEPAGTDGWFQTVPLVGMRSTTSLVVGARRQTTLLEPGTDFVAWPRRPDTTLTVDGEVVFVGYGIDAAEWRWDDFKGTPLAGRVLLVLVGDPGTADSTVFRGTEETYYARWTYKLEQAARMGAIGVLLIHDDASAGYPWRVVQNTFGRERVQLDRPVSETLRFAAWITHDAAERLVSASERDLAALIRRAQSRSFRPIELDAHAVVDMRIRVRRFRDANVVAQLPGRDPQRAREAVVFTAHYDHLGIGPSVQGDSIYNGAVDNASGVAALIASAAGMSGTAAGPARSTVFLATTGKEAGLLGAQAFVANPTVPLQWIAGVINVDRANVLGVTRDAAAAGAALSTLGEHFRQAAAAEGLRRSQPPDAGRELYRSDVLPFAQVGVPVLSLASGTDVAGHPPGWGRQQHDEYVRERFHQPSDEFSGDLELGGALQQVRLLLRLAWSVGDASDLPRWHTGSEFHAAGERLRVRRTR
jgi:Zn-dependent M28 family amino/carboxypeptidase